jgi:hypothetical protein
MAPVRISNEQQWVIQSRSDVGSLTFDLLVLLLMTLPILLSKDSDVPDRSNHTEELITLQRRPPL